MPYDFQNFNLFRRIARETFVNGYRSYKQFINLEPAPYQDRLNTIFACLDQQMALDTSNTNSLTNDKMRIDSNPFYHLFKCRSMTKPIRYALYFTLIDMLSKGTPLSLAQISKCLDCHVRPDDVLQLSIVNNEKALQQALDAFLNNNPFIMPDTFYRLNIEKSIEDIKVIISDYYQNSVFDYILLHVFFESLEALSLQDIKKAVEREFEKTISSFSTGKHAFLKCYDDKQYHLDPSKSKKEIIKIISDTYRNFDMAQKLVYALKSDESLSLESLKQKIENILAKVLASFSSGKHKFLERDNDNQYRLDLSKSETEIKNIISDYYNNSELAYSLLKIIPHKDYMILDDIKKKLNENGTLPKLCDEIIAYMLDAQALVCTTGKFYCIKNEIPIDSMDKIIHDYYGNSKFAHTLIRKMSIGESISSKGIKKLMSLDIFLSDINEKLNQYTFGEHAFLSCYEQYYLTTGKSKEDIKKDIIEENYADRSLAYALLRVMPASGNMSISDIKTALKHDEAFLPHYALPGFGIKEYDDVFWKEFIALTKSGDLIYDCEQDIYFIPTESENIEETRNTLNKYINGRQGPLVKAEEIKVENGKDTRKEYYYFPRNQNTTLYNSLQYFCSKGLLIFNKKNGTYSLPEISLDSLLKKYPTLGTAITFYSEYSPLGIVGSFIMDEHDITNRAFVFKNHHIQKALDSNVLYDLLEAIEGKTCITIYSEQNSRSVPIQTNIIPIKIFVRAGEGRHFLYMYDLTESRYKTSRLDNIFYVESITDENQIHIETEPIIQEGISRLQYIWGSILGNTKCRISINFINDEDFMIGNLNRECRNGNTKLLDNGEIQFTTEIFHSIDMVPWILGYAGKISHIEASKNDKQHLINRIIYHVSETYNLYYDNKSNKYSPSNIEPYSPLNAEALERYKRQYRDDPSDVFQAHHSKYISCLRHILEKLRTPQSRTQVEKIINDSKAMFNISELDNEISFDVLQDEIDSDETTGLGLIKTYPDFCILSGIQADARFEDCYCSNLHNATLELPLDPLELRWLTALVNDDPFSSLFFNEIELNELKGIFKDYKPLYRREDILYIDQYKDGDPYESPVYKKVFSTIYRAIEDDIHKVIITYQTEKERLSGTPATTYYIKPKAIEYNLQSNRMILIGMFTNDSPKGALNERKDTGFFYARLSNIYSATIVENSDSLPIVYEEFETKEPITVRLENYKNAFDRFQNMFTSYRKETILAEPIDSNESCIVKLWYSERDVKEVMQKLRTFGKAVEVIGPDKIRKDFADKAKKQYDLFVKAGLISHN